MDIFSDFGMTVKMLTGSSRRVVFWEQTEDFSIGVREAVRQMEMDGLWPLIIEGGRHAKKEQGVEVAAP